MKRMFGAILVLAGGLVLGGCATKKYVAQTVDPVKTKVDQVADQTTKQGTTLGETRKQLEQDEKELSATSETAKSADTRATTALGKTDTLGRHLDELRENIANLDDYKHAAEASVLFAFNSDKLSQEGRGELDKLVTEHGGYKRYFVTIEGFTDSIGPDDYNADLSRRRAYNVVQYLVTKHNIPLYRIQTVGLGKQKPVEEGQTRAARAKNRRVEVTIFSADAAMASTRQQGGEAAEAKPQKPQQ